jgi:CHASE3 domain sensor protein
MPLVEEPVIMTQTPKNIKQMNQVREKTVEVNQSGSENQGSNNSTTIILIVLGSAIFILACVYFYMSNKDRNRRLGIKSDYLPFTRSNY